MIQFVFKHFYFYFFGYLEWMIIFFSVKSSAMNFNEISFFSSQFFCIIVFCNFILSLFSCENENFFLFFLYLNKFFYLFITLSIQHNENKVTAEKQKTKNVCNNKTTGKKQTDFFDVPKRETRRKIMIMMMGIWW